MDAGIEVEGLKKRYRRTEALKGIGFRVGYGEAFALLGPNGAGKTTTLRALLGLVRRDGGRVRVAGLDPALAPREVRRQVGYVTGGMGLYDRLTGAEILAFFGRFYGIAGQALADRIEELDRAFDLGQALSTQVQAMSSGMRQKILVARAFLHRPRVLLLDEPTASLDVFARRALLDRVLAEKAAGRAVLYSTHVLPEAEEVADRVGFLYQGRLIFTGTPAEARERFRAPTLEHAFIQAAREAADAA